jgi:hypothetical protein
VAKDGANPSGASSSSAIFVSNPIGSGSNRNGDPALKGQPETVNRAYRAVSALRQSTKSNPSMSSEGGLVIEKKKVGAFESKIDGGAAICHFRSLMDKKQNICFSFNPATLKCNACPGRGEHEVGGEGGGELRQTFVLSDQNFSPTLPCSKGECLKIIRLEEGTLSEIVTCFLDITRCKVIATGSVILLASATHLQMRGVGGYAADLENEMARLKAVFRGGVIVLPGFLPSLRVQMTRGP